MKKILFIILIFLAYSCNTSKIPIKKSVSIEFYQQKTEPKPEPKPESKPKSILTKISINQSEVKKDIPVVKKVKSNIKPATISKSPGFDKGSINYVIQDTMIIGVITEVNMTISKGVDIKTIIADIKTFKDNNLHTDTIRIAPVMRARLVDSSNGINFIITSKTNAEQFLEIGDYTRWTWDITPLNKGKNKLSLIVDVIYENKSKSYQVYDGLIYVYSNETFFQKITKFIIKNWQYLLSSLLIPFIGFLYTRYKKKKH